MKKIWLTALFVLTLVGCNGNNGVVSSPNNSDIEHISNNISSNISENESVNANETSIVIEYVYANGQTFDRVEKKGEIGQTYSFVSPTINFMTPETPKIEFKLEETGFYQKVIYDYSYEVISEVKQGDKFTKFMADSKKGISFSYTISNYNSYLNPIIENGFFEIGNAFLRGKNYNYVIDFNDSVAVKSNNIKTNEFLCNSFNETYVNISINNDGSIVFYKNGMLQYTFLSTMRPTMITATDKEDRYLSDVIDNIFYGIYLSGFSIGNEGEFKIKDFSVGYGLTTDEVKEMYEKKKHLKIEYIDEFGNELKERKSVVSNEPIEYNYISPIISNFTCDKEIVSGSTSENIKETVTYTFDGQEKITSSMKENKENILDRFNKFDWANQQPYSIAKQIDGDFIIRMNYHLKGAASFLTSTNGKDVCWRTNLTSISNPSNGDRFVHRLDWYGWQDDINKDSVLLGSNPNYGIPYLENYDLDTFNVYNNCEITQTIERKGQNITSSHIIKPLNPGYENITYKYVVTLQNVSISQLNVDFYAEDAVITFNSIKIMDL